MKKRYVFKILIFFLMLVMITLNFSSAMSIGNLKGNTAATGDLKSTGNKIITIATTIGSVISVIVIIILGIKYMMGSVQEKAEYKRTLVPFLIGTLFIFVASTIASIIYNIAIKF